MPDYALVIDGEFQGIRRCEAQPEDIPHKNIKWYEVINEEGLANYSGIENGKWVIRHVPSNVENIVPDSITPRQARLLLLQQNLLAQVNILMLQQSEAAKITWEYALEFRRDDQLLAELATQLGLTNEQLDQFFIQASKL